ncbi:enoyl-CoA hydratase-related protein [Xenophilus arseniciresistens]|uniref:Enoyl-CoA hydratase-related protein n=1 Tax=Xenophilus arseniciresistens TaxID=1283306 RepID=A0AAE3N6V6_9BURK|nr:enoyl-CoA hydratase-related protein [Xenophilus arseniciresistens]MDA7415973.1 enoyl-CoA hydratase-related protein [Xenophilus arseniciresistens]
MDIPELVIDGALARIMLRRPEQANRLEPADLAALQAHIDTVNARPEVLALRIEAQGKYFCSGYDLTRIGQPRGVPFEEVVNSLENARPVTVAVIQGGVYGGATDLSLACDFRLGVRGIDMFMPAARLGLHFYRSGLERYVSRLGLNNAKRLFLTAERVDAQTLKEMGFLTHLLDDAQQLNATADALTQTICAMAPLPLVSMKKHLNRIARHMLDADELRRDIVQAVDSDDLREGQAAWAEKRKPRFTGR